MNSGLVPITIGRIDGIPHLAWAEGIRCSLPQSSLAGGLQCSVDSDGCLRVTPPIPPIPAGDVEALRTRAAFTDRKPASSRFPVPYQRVPAPIRSLVATAIGRWKRHDEKRWASFPGWPVDLSADVLSDLSGGPRSPFAAGLTPVLLTHDLDSPEGVVNLVRHFLKLEESVGACSTSFIVPCAWPIDHELLAETKARGHEIGVHGYDHANRTPFLDADGRKLRLEAAGPLIERYGAHGYRSPALLRTRALLRDLSHLYRYDSSIPTSGGPFPVPNNGCASARPFVVEGIVEIPLSMPRDGSLVFMGYSPQAILDLWISSADLIARSGGVVVLLTHCESRFSGMPAMREVYRRFLEHVASSGRFCWSTPDQVLQRWAGQPWTNGRVPSDGAEDQAP